MAAVATISIAFALVFLVCASDFSCASASGRGGFTIDLIHRDSPRSPFYNSSETPSQRLKNAFGRSFDRLSHFNPSSEVAQLDQAESTIIKSDGEYLIEFSIGTPPFPIKAIADTGSDLIWTQCKPCNNCYQQNDPLFDPSKSSTYQTIPCSSNQCNTLQGSCSSQDSACQYEVRYGDRSHPSHTIGDYAADTVTLASTTGTSVSFLNTLIGCGHDNAGTSFHPQASGIVGLGGGDESLISQLGTSIDGKFSYCLTLQNDQTSKLSFGDNAVVSGSGVVSTPLFQHPSQKTFFFLTLEAISVDDTKIPLSSSSSASGGGNIVIDSGTTFTLLEPSFYSELEEAVDKAIGRERVNEMPPCYKVSASEDFKTPNIIVHFSGADVKLEQNNAFRRGSQEACFAFAPSENSISIYGNVAQSGFLVGYDLKGKTVSFKPTDCTKF
ncbi:hypothetical protein M0R45_013901 [Rubus argutus]|uniref:Peptidase A1 domain-containing protein n=1 Tax=Rubus argutus TaxID=59490 RepID=A0AAW1XKP8_RUBAR